jgi:hypothetical protein
MQNKTLNPMFFYIVYRVNRDVSWLNMISSKRTKRTLNNHVIHVHPVVIYKDIFRRHSLYTGLINYRNQTTRKRCGASDGQA